MKKYTIKDNLGNKKTIYADDLNHALTFVDSKVKDDIDAVMIVGIRYNKYVVMDKTATKVLSPKFNDVDDAYNWIKKNYPRAKVLDSKVKDVRVEKGDWFTLRQRSDVLYKVIDDQNKSYNGFTEAMIVEKYKIDFADLRKSHEIKIIKVGNESFHPEKLSTEIIKFNSSKEAIDWFKRQKELRSRKYDSIHDSYVEVPLVLNRFQIEAIKENWFDIKDTGKKENGWPVYRLTGDKEKIFRWLRTRYDKKFPLSAIHDSIHDEASLATTINALVNDEKAAIDAYNVAIKNLEGSIDDTARQVLINIRDDERRHIENLYSILNGQVTEKNLKDSIHDAVKSPSAYVNTRLVKKYATK